MVMDYCPGGDLAVRRKKEGSFSEKIVKFYTAEIILALQYLHENLNIIHRYSYIYFFNKISLEI